MQNTNDWELLARYLAGECSTSDKEKVEIWLDTDPENRKLMQLLKAIWGTPEIKPEASDVKELWLSTARKAGIIPEPEPSKSSFRLPRIPRLPRLVPYAMLVLAVVLIPYFIWKSSLSSSSFEPVSELQHIKVARGEQEYLILSDGTRVTLDAGTSFQYPLTFAQGAREVILDGEAYFEVPRINDNPFIIHANGAFVQVMGTTFNVRAWQSNNKVEVAVSTGRVLLRAEEDTEQRSVIIQGGQLSILADGKQPTEPQSVDVKRYMGWLRREADFEDIPLREILFQLERWFDIELVLTDESIAEEHLTIHIEDRPIEETLALIATLTDQEYERNGGQIVFKPKH